MKKILSSIGILIWVLGCSATKVSKYETNAYRLASPENKQRIDEGKIEKGMSIDECKASHPDYQFVRKFTTSDGRFELWEATDKPNHKAIYLHIENGKVAKVSEDIRSAPKHTGISNNNRKPSAP